MFVICRCVCVCVCVCVGVSVCARVRACVSGHCALGDGSIQGRDIPWIIIHTIAEEKLAKSSTVTEAAINRQFDTNGFYQWLLVPFCFKTGCLLFLNSLNFFKLKRKVNLIYA